MSLFRIVIVLAVLVVGLGFYRGWFTLTRATPTPGSSTVNVNLATDVDKMKQDAQTVKDKAAGLTSGGTEERKADGQANDALKSK